MHNGLLDQLRRKGANVTGGFPRPHASQDNHFPLALQKCGFDCQVVYLTSADKYGKPLPNHLLRVNQIVISPRNKFFTLVGSEAEQTACHYTHVA
jgi:hypothetical protein